MEEKTIKNIPAVPFAVMMGAISAVIGLVVGIFWAVGFGAMMASIPGAGEVAGFAGILGVAMIIIMPIAGFIGGLIQGLIIAVIYNVLAPRIGGIKLVFAEDSRPPPPP